MNIDFSGIISGNITSNLEVKDDEAVISGVDFSSFTKGYTINNEPTVEADSEKKKRGRPPKSANYVPVVKEGQGGYIDNFTKTNAMLEVAIAQTDQLSAEIKEDIDVIRASKTMKNKYTYITNLTSSSAALIGTKVQAIREMNNSTKDALKLDLDRAKMNKDAEAAQTDEGRIMELYKAFINTPVGSVQGGVDLFAGTNNLYNPASINAGGDLPITGQLTPEQQRMRMENNPNITTVVKFNQSTGQRFFDVIDRTNGQSIPNYPRPDAFLLEDTIIDVHAMAARNKNLDTVWPLVLIGDGGVSEY